MEDQLPEVLDFTWLQWLKEEGPWIWLLALVAVALGLWHFSISIRCLLRRAPHITVAHHLIHLFAPVALLFLSICASPFLGPAVMMPPGETEGWLQYISKYPVFYGSVGLAVFLPNMFLAFLAIYRSPHHSSPC